MQYSIEEYEQMLDSDTPCFFICPKCNGDKYRARRVDYAPQICPDCEGSGIKIIPDNTTNNPFVLRNVLACVVQVDSDSVTSKRHC